MSKALHVTSPTIFAFSTSSLCHNTFYRNSSGGLLMLTTREALHGLFGAYRLALMDKTGLTYLDRSPAGTARSFWVAGLVLPFYLAMLLMWPEADDKQPPLLDFLVVQSLQYCIALVGFALVVNFISRKINRSERYLDFLCTYNWSAAIQVIVFFPIVSLGFYGVIPHGMTDALLLVFTAAMEIYLGFITWVTLQVNWQLVVGLVVLEMWFNDVTGAIASSILAQAG